MSSMDGSAAELEKGNVAAVIYGWSAIFIGVGLGRFAFTPLIPVLIEAGWYDPAQAKMLGAYGLIGYLCGGVVTPFLARQIPVRSLGIASALIVLASFIFCIFPIAYPWAALWRFLAGAAGAILMIACTSAANARLVRGGRAIWSGLPFVGVGSGAVIAAILMPLFADTPVEWQGLAITVFCVLAVAIHLWTAARLGTMETRSRKQKVPRAAPGRHRALLWALLAYGCDGFGMTPHSVYLVDYATREVGLSNASGALIWAGFGVGALLGPFLAIRIGSQRIGWAFAFKALAIALVVTIHNPWLFTLSSFCVGLATPGIAVMLSGFIQAAGDSERHIRYWANATTTFAFAQAIGGLAVSRVSQFADSYQPAFALGAAIMAFGFVAILYAGRILRDSTSQGSA